MPTHRDLSSILGISRGTVARAYDEARRLGLLDIGIGQGTFVSQEQRALALTPSTGEIEFSMAYPLYELDPDPATALHQLAKDPDRGRLLRYPPAGGPVERRSAGALWCAACGVEVEANDILETAGAQHAIHVWLLAAFQPGDTLLTGRFTYRMAVAAAETLGVQVRGVDMDAEGILPDALDQEAQRTKATGLFVMPTVQNPTTGVLSEGRRHELLDVVRRRGLQVLEDDTYAPFLPSRPTALKELCPERVTYVASFSKSVAGGLRVAYAVPPKILHAAFASGVATSVWSPSSLSAELAARWIVDGTATTVVDAKRREAASRLDLLRERLAPQVPELETGAYFAWLTLPPPWTASGFTLEARQQGVLVMPATSFFVGDERPPESLRISLGCSTRHEVERGLAILEALLRRTAQPLKHIV